MPAAAVTFVAAVHAHHASVRTHVALHALHPRLAGAQARHLLAVVAHRARGVAVARCPTERKRERERNKTVFNFQVESDYRGRRTQRRAHVSVRATCRVCVWLGRVSQRETSAAVGGTSEGGREVWEVREEDNENVIETQEKQPRGRTSTPWCSWNH